MRDYRQIYKDHYRVEFSRDYDIHHIDLNRENNEIDNLLLLPKKLHHQYHFALDYLTAMAKEEDYPEHLCMFSGKIEESGRISYKIGALKRFASALEECSAWYDFKLYLEGLMPDTCFMSIEDKMDGIRWEKR